MCLLKFLRPLLGLFACVVILSGCSRKEPAPDPVRAVKLLEIKAQPLEKVVEYAGDVRASTESSLGFQVSGKLLQRLVNVGDSVRKGQLLAQLDGQDYALAVQAAQAQVVAAKTQRDLAQADWQRFSALKDQGFISGVELDRRKANVQAAQAQLEQAQAQAASQSNQRNYTHLYAGADGVITAVAAEPGQVVAAGSPVVRMAHDGARDAVINVPEDVRSLMPVGKQVQVRAWASNDHWDGGVRELAASADPVTRTYVAKVGLEGADQPALGSTVQVVAQLDERVSANSAIKLPSTALLQQGGESAVWVFEGATSTLRLQKVTVQGVQGNDILIAEGLTVGMQVVATGTHVLTQGQKVSVYQPAYPQAKQ